MAYSHHLTNAHRDFFTLSPSDSIVVYLEQWFGVSNSNVPFLPRSEADKVRRVEEAVKKIAAPTLSSEFSVTKTGKFFQKLAELAIRNTTGRMPSDKLYRDMIEVALDLDPWWLENSIWSLLPISVAQGAKDHQFVPSSRLPNSISDGSCTRTKLEGHCASCGKHATNMCVACKEDTTDSVPTMYCGTACQKNDWKTYKQVCKRLQARRTFYRAAAVIQSLWYIWREHYFDHQVIAVEEKRNILYVFLGDWCLKKEEKASPRIDFPSRLVPIATEKEALLSVHECFRCTGHMQEPIQVFLQGTRDPVQRRLPMLTAKGTYSEIQEMYVLVKNAARPTVIVGCDGRPQHTMFDQHTLLRVTLKTGEEFCLDITGAQFGWHEPVLEWEEFSRIRIRQTLDRQPFGNRRKEFLDEINNRDRDWGGKMRREDCVTLLMIALQEWVVKEKISPGALLNFPVIVYRQKKTALLSFVKEMYEKHVRELDKQGKYLAVPEEGDFSLRRTF